MADSLIEKYLRPKGPIGVLLKGTDVTFKGFLVEFDEQYLVLMGEGEQGRSFVVVERAEIKAVLVGMMNET